MPDDRHGPAAGLDTALAENATADQLLDAVLGAVPAPRIELAREASA